MIDIKKIEEIYSEAIMLCEEDYNTLVELHRSNSNNLFLTKLLALIKKGDKGATIYIEKN